MSQAGSRFAEIFLKIIFIQLLLPIYKIYKCNKLNSKLYYKVNVN